MLGWLGQLAYGSALALGAHFLIVGIRLKPLRGQAWLGLILVGAALASLMAGGRGSLSGPLSIGLAAGAAAGSVLLSHRFLALHMADRRSMRALARAYADLQASARMRELGVSAASISHEIRNYAAALKGNASLLDRMWDGAGRPAELERIRASAERMEAITRDINAFAGAAGPLRPRSLDLESVLRGCFDGRFPGKRAEIRCSGPARLRGDPARLEQAFVNFFRNAWEAGATVVDVRLSAWRGKLIVAIEDDGMGCAPEDLDRLTVPFFTRKAQGGTGLGTSIAESILRAHGATLRAYSKNVLGGGRQGLVLNLVFPAEAPPSPDPGAELPVAAGQGPTRENLIRPMLHLGLRPRFLEAAPLSPLSPLALDPRDVPGRASPMFLDGAAAGRAAFAGRPAIVVGEDREAVRRPGGRPFLFSEEALMRILEGGISP
jgi:signal transduction histidine kinase